MKRYWKNVILPLFIVITFGVLYVHHAIAKEGLPQFELVNVSDDEGIGEDIIIYGNYVADESSVWESFRLSSDGISYSSERNFLEQFNEFFESQEMEKLREEERGFMRGKEVDPHLYSKDAEQIAYVGPSALFNDSFEFEVDVLDREIREKKSFKLDIPDSDGTDHIYVDHVQLLDDMLYVTTTNYLMEDKELHIYQISLQDETIEDRGAIAGGTIHGHFIVLNNGMGLKRQENIIVRAEYIEWNEGMHTSEVVDEEYFTYDLETGKKQVFEVPEEFAMAEESTEQEYMEEEQDTTEEVIYPTNHESVGSEELYFITFTSDGINYYPYHLQENKLLEEKEISFDENILSGLSGVYTKGDHLYFYSNAGEDGNQMKKLFKVDLVNGEIVYEGEIKLTDAPKETHVYNVEVFNVEEKR
ncbi:hypothetical protein [Oceanobacillus alkalisoli]|uniref:hypothetical protein n=1 Tax=Oceanobacillus alkalisoli TaxID=2925113 RepID=UPI001F11CFBD|nr:hypothetical protein [Oceanobacillus alkalisoli]MCF3944810.1 hypothetical protein [Oceanobacillus alkalisoli]